MDLLAALGPFTFSPVEAPLCLSFSDPHRDRLAIVHIYLKTFITPVARDYPTFLKRMFSLFALSTSFCEYPRTK